MKFKFTNSEKTNEYYNEIREIEKLLLTLNLENINSHISKIIDNIDLKYSNSHKKNITFAKLILLFENRFNLQDYYAKIIARLYIKYPTNDLIWTFNDFESEICTYILKNTNNKDILLSVFSNIQNKDKIATNKVLLNFILENNLLLEFSNKYTDYCLKKNDITFLKEYINYFFSIFIKNLDFNNLSLIYSNLYRDTNDDFLLKCYEFYQKLSSLFTNLSIKNISNYPKEINDFTKFVKKKKFQDFEIFFTYFLNPSLELKSLEFDLDYVPSDKLNISKEKLNYLKELIFIYENGYDSIDSFSEVTYLNFIFKDLLYKLSEETLKKLTFYKHNFLNENINISSNMIKELPSKEILDIVLSDICSPQISPTIVKEKIFTYSYFKDIKLKNKFSKDFDYKNKSRCINLILSLIDKLEDIFTFNIISFDFNSGNGVLKIDSKIINFFYMQTINDRDVGVSYLHIENSSNSIDLEIFTQFMRYYFLVKQFKDIFLEIKTNFYPNTKEITINALTKYKFNINDLYYTAKKFDIDFTDFLPKNHENIIYLNNKSQLSFYFGENQSLIMTAYDDFNYFSSFEVNYSLIECV